jgi:diguanylate cyclase (GGDEF)-like protein
MIIENALNPIQVLLIEDNIADTILTKRMLEKQGGARFRVACAGSLTKGINIAEKGVDVVLLDLNLPDSAGEETFLKLELMMPDIPVVVLSDFGDESTSVGIVQKGAQDYLIKGKVDAAVLVRTLLFAIERKKAAESIKKLAFYDALTGLPNRILFTDRFNLAMAENRRNPGKIALVMLDMDHFKEINDNLGHDAGDSLLKDASQRILNILRETDTACRLGGDEFALMITGAPDKDRVQEIAGRILDALRSPFDLHGIKQSVTASLGISLYPDDGELLKTLIERADIAMYEAKKAGRNSYQFYQTFKPYTILKV